MGRRAARARGSSRPTSGSVDLCRRHHDRLQLMRKSLGSTTRYSGSEHLYFLVYAAFPKPNHPEYGAIDGAYVSLFVNEPVQAAAEALAVALIGEQGWEVEELDEAYPVHLDMYPPGHPSREHFEQAEIDSVVATFHRWPVGAPEDE